MMKRGELSQGRPSAPREDGLTAAAEPAKWEQPVRSGRPSPFVVWFSLPACGLTLHLAAGLRRISLHRPAPLPLPGRGQPAPRRIGARKGTDMTRLFSSGLLAGLVALAG